MKYKKFNPFSIFVATHSKPFLAILTLLFSHFWQWKPLNVTSFEIGHVLTNQISLDNKNKNLYEIFGIYYYKHFFFLES
jgi:hypothetical protein